MRSPRLKRLESMGASASCMKDCDAESHSLTSVRARGGGELSKDGSRPSGRTGRQKHLSDCCVHGSRSAGAENVGRVSVMEPRRRAGLRRQPPRFHYVLPEQLTVREASSDISPPRSHLGDVGDLVRHCARHARNCPAQWPTCEPWKGRLPDRC